MHPRCQSKRVQGITLARISRRRVNLEIQELCQRLVTGQGQALEPRGRGGGTRLAQGQGMNITLDIPTKNIKDAINGACIRYWASERYWDTSGPDDLTFYVEERDGDPYLVTPDRLRSALEIMAAKCPRQFAELLDGHGDGSVGDALVQCAAFGELRYG